MNARMIMTLFAIGLFTWPFASATAKADESKIKELQKERLAILKDVSRLALERLRVGQGTVDELREAGRMLLDAELDLCASDKERVEVLERHLGQARDIEKMMDQLAKAGMLGTKSTLTAKADRLQVEIALARAKDKMEGRK